MGKKKAAKGKTRARVKDLPPKSARAVKGGKVSMQDFHFMQNVNKASS